MSRPRIMSVFGTRPEAIKMAPVVRALESDAELDHRLVVTAQHRGLLDDVLELFTLTPDHDLDIMRESQSLNYITSSVLTGMAGVLEAEQPDFLLVHGDTTTTFVAALAAFYAKVPVGHVEAGLRTSSIVRPFPEELNRRIADLIARHYYCPTEGAARNLQDSEHPGEVFITGNTALDAVAMCRQDGFTFSDEQLAGYAGHTGPKLLVTVHRRENWGEPLVRICEGIAAVLVDHPEARACICTHPNPVVKERVRTCLGANPRVLLKDAPRYDVFINLLARADLVLTDSGGIQEEVTQLRRFALVLRDETERPEAVEAGYAQLVGSDPAGIRQVVGTVLPRCLSGEVPAGERSPYGDGRAAARIHQALRWHFGLGERPADYLAG